VRGPNADRRGNSLNCLRKEGSNSEADSQTSFISRKNTREDGYGGPLDRRLRLPLEVFAAVRASVPPDFSRKSASKGGSRRAYATSARQSLADPDWTLKISRGCDAEVRTCEFTNYCEALDQKHKVVTCQLWDELDVDAAETVRSPDGKRRLVAPDWPAPTQITRSESE
jgi:hypothetical protein